MFISLYWRPVIYNIMKCIICWSYIRMLLCWTEGASVVFKSCFICCITVELKITRFCSHYHSFTSPRVSRSCWLLWPSHPFGVSGANKMMVLLYVTPGMCHMRSCRFDSSSVCHWPEMDLIPHVRADRTWVAVLLLSLWPCSSAAAEPQGAHGDRAACSLQGMQETLTLTTGALPLHLSKSHCSLYTSMWFAAHKAPVDSDFQLVKDTAPALCLVFTGLLQTAWTQHFPKCTRAF